ncbi:Uncharacterized protein APZ42_034465 [Daphnia magna]|uniref:Uncharacterized protein n=1 Tax=Daphnia magna TaxID=35525 RepID=A0A164K7H1_9CRUS|nr:Uncharacterized protein APZ42_034465 [Daphnia magna]
MSHKFQVEGGTKKLFNVNKIYPISSLCLVNHYLHPMKHKEVKAEIG